MLVHVKINGSDAVRAGKARCGNYSVELSEADLARLSEAERNILAGLREIGSARPDERYVDRLVVIEPTVEQVVGAVAKLVLEAEQKAAREREKEEEDFQEGLEKIREWLANYEADPASVRVGWDEEVRKVYMGWANEIGQALEKRNPPELAKYRKALSEAQAEAARLKAERKARQEAAAEKKEAEKKAAREAYEAERKSWIEEHGTDHLKALLSEGLGLNKSYRDERLARERPGWLWYQEICGGAVGARDPSPDVITALREARLVAPDATIMWLTDEDHMPGCPHREHWSEQDGYDPGSEPFEARFVLVAKFLGAEIIREID